RKGGGQPERAHLGRLEPREEPPREPDLAIIGDEETREQIEHRRLPRPVRSDQAKHLPLGHGEIEAAHGEEPAEPLPQPRDFEQAHARRRARRRTAGYAPWGRKRTTAIRRRTYTIRCTPVHPLWAR